MLLGAFLTSVYVAGFHLFNVRHPNALMVVGWVLSPVIVPVSLLIMLVMTTVIKLRKSVGV
jgi:hypothetical protein